MKVKDIVFVSFWLVVAFLHFTYPVLVGDYDIQIKYRASIFCGVVSLLIILLSSQLFKEEEVK